MALSDCFSELFADERLIRMPAHQLVDQQLCLNSDGRPWIVLQKPDNMIALAGPQVRNLEAACLANLRLIGGHVGQPARL